MSITLRNNIKPISYIKTHAAEMLRYVNETKNPMIITQNGEGKAVLQDIESYQKIQDAFALLNIIKIGERDIEAGRVHDKDEVFREIEERHKQLYGEEEN